MKHIIVLLATFLTLSLVLNSCSKDDTTGNHSCSGISAMGFELCGNWENVDYPVEVWTIYQSNGMNKVKLTSNGYVALDCPFYIGIDTTFIRFDNYPNISDSAVFKISKSNDTLMLTNSDNGNLITQHFLKQ